MKYEELKTKTGVWVRTQNWGSRTKNFEVPINLIAPICKEIAEESEMGDIVIKTYNFNEIVGCNNCIPINKNSKIIIERPIGEAHGVQWVQEKPEPTSLVTIVIIKAKYNYILLDGYFGPERPKYPWKCTDEKERKKAEEFWKTHAWCVPEK